MGKSYTADEIAQRRKLGDTAAYGSNDGQNYSLELPNSSFDDLDNVKLADTREQEAQDVDSLNKQYGPGSPQPTDSLDYLRKTAGVNPTVTSPLLQAIQAKGLQPTDILNSLRGMAGVNQNPAIGTQASPSNAPGQIASSSGPNGVFSALGSLSAPPATPSVPSNNPIAKVAERNPTGNVTPQQPAPELLNTLPLLRAAQNAANNNQYGANMLKASETISDALARTPNQNRFADLESQANRPVEQLQQMTSNAMNDQKLNEGNLRLQEQMESSDPNNAVSVAARNILRQAGVNVPDNFTASQLQGNPVLEKLLGTIESAKMRNAYLGMARQDKLDQRARLSDKELTDVNNIDNAIETIKRLEANPYLKQTGPLNSRENKLAQLVGVDDPNYSAFNADLTQNLLGRVKQMEGNRVTANFAALMEPALPTGKERPETTKAKLDLNLQQLLRAKKTLLKNYANQGKNISQYEDADTSAPPPGNQHPQDQQAIEWAKQNPDKPQAQKIFKLNGLM